MKFKIKIQLKVVNFFDAATQQILQKPTYS